jgi:hypothetical protein
MTLCEISLPANQLRLSVTIIYWCMFYRASLKKKVVNVYDSIPTKGKATHTPVFDINFSTRLFIVHGDTVRSGPGPPNCQGFTLRKTTLGKFSLDE